MLVQSVIQLSNMSPHLNHLQNMYNAITPNLDHITPKPELITLIDITVKLPNNEMCKIQITEDPTSHYVINFKDFNSQIQSAILKVIQSQKDKAKKESPEKADN